MLSFIYIISSLISLQLMLSDLLLNFCGLLLLFGNLLLMVKLSIQLVVFHKLEISLLLLLFFDSFSIICQLLFFIKFLLKIGQCNFCCI